MKEEFWESFFKNEGTSWGSEPSDSAIQAADLFYNHQLNKDGMMIFCSVSDQSDLLKSGKRIGTNYYLLTNGLKVYFYNDSSVEKEFEQFGLIEIRDIEEPIKFATGIPAMKFKMITCTRI